MNYSIHESLHENLNPILELNWPTSDELIFDAVKKLVIERDDALERVTAAQDKLNGVTKELDVVRMLSTPAQRYVLHGDIQPCSVLYSDETTTLLRLDEGDVMCETETIEWSDSVTYRCQELLKSCGGGRPVDILAQLVRDERILFNDNETAGAITYTPTRNLRYEHDSTLSEEDLCKAGWTTVDLVQNGYGSYVPRDAKTQIAVGTTPEDVANMIVNSLNSPASEKLADSIRRKER